VVAVSLASDIATMAYPVPVLLFRVRILKGIPSCHGAYLYLRNNGAWER
jgi:hypothetical protein